MGHEIIPYRPEFADRVAELERPLWGEDTAANVAHLRWKYEETPLRAHSFLFLALANGEVVGARGLLGRCWEAGRSSARFVAPVAADLVIAPEHRGSGLLGELTGAALEHVRGLGYPFALNFSASPVNRVNSLIAGWREVGSIEVLERAGNPPSARRHPGVRRDEDPLRAFERKPLGRLREAVGRLWMAREPQPDEMADLVRRVPRDGRIREVRDEAYFRWRFANPRACNRFVFCGESHLAGYLVLQMRRHRPEQGIWIVDVEATCDAVRGELLGAASAWAGFDKLRVWGCSVPDGARALLRNAGFAARTVDPAVDKYRPAMLLKFLDADAAAELERAGGRQPGRLDDWDLRTINSDAF